MARDRYRHANKRTAERDTDIIFGKRDKDLLGVELPNGGLTLNLCVHDDPDTIVDIGLKSGRDEASKNCKAQFNDVNYSTEKR